jgi:hypothetical protein
MKLLLAAFVLISTSAFATENESCWGGLYWALMEKSERICHTQAQMFESQHNLSCRIKYHNSPNVCWSDCSDANGTRIARLRVDMSSICDFGSVYFHKTKITWYR